MVPADAGAAPPLAGPAIDLLDIAALGLEPGGGQERAGHVAFEPLLLGGHSYGVPSGRSAVRLRASAPPGGLHVHLVADVVLSGPCWRCLEQTTVEVPVETHTYHEYAAPEGDDLHSDYVADDAIAVARWLRDSVAEAMPQTILCRADCAGLCGGCGADLNTADCSCPPAAPDARWGPLAELAERMREPDADD